MLEPEKEPDNIIEFKPRDPNEMPIERKLRGYDEHKHGRLQVDLENRIIICRICGESIGPWAAIISILNGMETVKYKYRAVQEWEEKKRKEFEIKQKKRAARREMGGTML